MVELMVQDNGQGFVWETAVAAGGLGLTSLRERAAQLNGEIEIQSAPAKGTTVVVRLPVNGNPITDYQ